MLAIRLFVFLYVAFAVQGQEPEPAAQLPAVARDRLGRSTPRGAVFGFLGAANQQDYSAAAQFLDTPLEGAAAAELASQLNAVLDRRLPAHLDQLSTQPEGTLNDNLPLGNELVGVIQTSQGPLNILLERVRRGSGMIWLFSAETLKSIPDVYGQLNASPLDGLMPAWLARHVWLSLPLWQWVALLTGLALAVGVSVVLRRVAAPLLRSLIGPLLGEQDNHLLDLLIAPVRVLVVLGLVEITVEVVRLPLIARHVWGLVEPALWIIAFTWLFLRIIRILGGVALGRLQRVGRGDAASVIRMIEWAVTFTALLVAVVIVFRAAGFDVTGVLAGLGVGGIAIALAAQKTIENLFGGISIIFDKPIRVGDLCRVGNQEGRVEDIGLRSTRFRTVERALLTIPNGQLSVMSLENLGMRDKMLFRHTVGLRCETTSRQLSAVMEGLRSLLAGHAEVETSTARVRLIKLGPGSMDIDVFAYVFRRETEGFLVIQEELLVRILDVIETIGTAIALPSQAIYLNRDSAANRKPAAEDSPPA